MIYEIKEKIWNLLKDKEVSLAMIYDDEGNILWHRGRRIIETRKLDKGCGYCTTPARTALKERQKSLKDFCVATYTELHTSESAKILNIRSVVILPVADRYFLYVDSGEKESFSEGDLAVFESMGSLLSGFISELRSGKAQGPNISGTSAEATRIREKVVRFAIEEEPVLLLGETGVGKSHVAEMIHACSGRSGPFIAVNTPGIPDTLIESQLFGHRKGAFSGAVSEGEGLVAAAENGTLFLDEISEVEPALQAKLLRFIDTHMYRRLGDTAERRANVRIIAATNRDLQEMIAQKTFREDLFFRLNFLTIEIPPLRKRRTDIEALLEEHLGLLRGKRLSSAAREKILRYDWPGNVRELLQVLKVAGIQFSGEEIGPEIEELLVFRCRPAGADSGKADRIWDELMAGKNFWAAVKEPFLMRDLNRDEVKEILARGLQETGGTYKELLPLFHLDKKEYKNFMRFLYENRLK